MKNVLKINSSDEMIIKMIFDKSFSGMSKKKVNKICKYLPMLIRKFHKYFKNEPSYRSDFIIVFKEDKFTSTNYLSITNGFNLEKVLPKSNGYIEVYKFLYKDYTYEDRKRCNNSMNEKLGSFCYNYINKLYPEYLKEIKNGTI